jgi:hypothetical protein
MHRPTSTFIFLHSVVEYHPASIEMTRSLMQIVQPGMLAVCAANDAREALDEGLAERQSVAKDRDDVRRIADGYHRVVQGAPSL